jgi:hypothetical protein
MLEQVKETVFVKLPSNEVVEAISKVEGSTVQYEIVTVE